MLESSPSSFYMSHAHKLHIVEKSRYETNQIATYIELFLTTYDL